MWNGLNVTPENMTCAKVHYSGNISMVWKYKSMFTKCLGAFGYYIWGMLFLMNGDQRKENTPDLHRTRERMTEYISECDCVKCGDEEWDTEWASVRNTERERERPRKIHRQRERTQLHKDVSWMLPMWAREVIYSLVSSSGSRQSL